MTVSLGAAQELFSGVLKISLALIRRIEFHKPGGIREFSCSQNFQFVDFCTINPPRSPSGMLMARKIWHAFFLQPNVLIHFLS